MKILSFGSINIDYVYTVPHFVIAGETLSATSYKIFTGGKGANQSVAMARAGLHPFLAGKIGKDGLFLKTQMESEGIDTTFIEICNEPTGHAIIQLTPEGENAIIIYGGANHSITPEFASAVIKNFDEGDILVIQNEISNVSKIIEIAALHKMRIFFNPAPISEEVKKYPLQYIQWICLNEIEACGLAGKNFDIKDTVSTIAKICPQATVILTLGSKGAIWYNKTTGFITCKAFETNVVDTTAAGDTFIGYLITGIVNNLPPENALKTACLAASICVSRLGAQSSIPYIHEIEPLLA